MTDGTYAWEEGRQLSKINVIIAIRINFKYDDSGIRTQKSVKVDQNSHNKLPSCW